VGRRANGWIWRCGCGCVSAFKKAGKWVNAEGGRCLGRDHASYLQQYAGLSRCRRGCGGLHGFAE